MIPSLETLRRQVETPMRQHGVVHAGVFGSVARGDARPDSDVDFLVEFERGRSLLDLVDLQVELREALGRDVDVATRNSLHPRLRDRILREVVPLL
jgi:predicted nucleotidyltransferase